jgi:hypothetical protein
MLSGPPEHNSLFPLCRQNTSTISDRQRGPCEAMISFLRFLRNDLSVKTSDGSRWLDQVKDAHAQSKSSSRLPSLCSTQPDIKGLLRPVTYYDGESNLCAGGSCKSSHHRLRTECTYSRTTRSCARSVRRATRSQCGVPQLALRDYPDDALDD